MDEQKRAQAPEDEAKPDERIEDLPPDETDADDVEGGSYNGTISWTSGIGDVNPTGAQKPRR